MVRKNSEVLFMLITQGNIRKKSNQKLPSLSISHVRHGFEFLIRNKALKKLLSGFLCTTQKKMAII
jgi:hypothetical protein